MSRQSKSVVISLKPNRIIMMSDDTTNHKFWCSINTQTLFSSHVMEGVVGTSEFRIEMNSLALSKSLKLANSQSKSLSVRLSKKSGQPVLLILIEEVCQNTHKTREVIHEIQLQILSRRLYHEYDKQEYPVHVLFDLINMDRFANISRKMKSLGRSAIITLVTAPLTPNQSRSFSGEPVSRTMVVSSNVTGCQFDTVFKNVRLSTQAGVPRCSDPPPDPNQIQITVDTKMLHQFLGAFKRRNMNLTIGIRLDRYMTFYMSGTEYTIDYLMPVLTC